MQMVNREIDDARKAEKARAKKLKNGRKKSLLEEGLKSAKSVLLKNKSDFNEKQSQKLE